MRTSPLLAGLVAGLLSLTSPAVFAQESPAGASQADVDRLIEEGRRLLDLKKPTEAEGIFLQAQELEGGSIKTRMWVLRAWMDQGGRNNDTLDALDDIRAVHDGPDVDYLYGMAFARRAEEQLAANALQAIEMNFGSAIELLMAATEADPLRYRDAFLPLARAAWYTRDLETARAAAEQAYRRYPDDPECAYQLGQIALSQFTVAKDDPELVSESERAWESARDAFLRAVELSGKPNRRDERGQGLLARAHLQHGHTVMWKNQTDVGKESYAAALAWDPAAVDLSQLFGMLGAEGLNEVVEDSTKAFAKRYGKKDDRDATMLWWLGYTRFASRKVAESEEAFLRSLDKMPDSANAWHYVGLARYDGKNFEGTAEALRKGWGIDPAAMVSEMQGSRDLNLAKVEYVVGWCVEREQWADAAVLAELCAETAVDVARYWNNMGFFLREEGARLTAEKDEAEAARSEVVFEQAFVAYQRALDLSPEDPTFLNDTAVILHYYLKRDLDRALAWYDEAAERADSMLAAGGLSTEQEDLVRTALRDSTNNRRKLKKLLKERSAAPARG
ncbi:MAG: tetratricopeptide repeat protein [Planctomycetota bacterium]